MASDLSLKTLLDLPLMKLGGGVLTPGSIILGIGIFAASLLFARFASSATQRVLHSRGLSTGAQFAVSKMLRYVVWALGLAIAFDSMGVKLDALLAASAVLAVGIGFGLQNIAQNFISGIILLIEQPVSTGDFVRVGDAFGVVDDIGLRATRIVTRDEVTIIVPNSQFISQSVTNHSRPTLKLRIQVGVGVAYGSDTARVRETLLAAATSVEHVLKIPAPSVRFENFGDSSLDFKLLVWIAEPRTDHQISSDLRFAIDAAFRAAKIEIPFPQRDLHLRSGLEPLLRPQ